MGSWGIGSFDNDTAVDWSYGLEGTNDVSYVAATLDRVLAVPEGVEIPAEIAECAIAASEVLARALGSWGDESPYTETADAWVRQTGIVPTLGLVAKVRAVLDRVVGRDSELGALWEEAGERDAWIATVRDLQRRIDEAPGSRTP